MQPRRRQDDLGRLCADALLRQAEFEAKRDFVARAAASRRWRLAWDIGCNTGTFSRIAAEHADSVVAMDGDWMAVEQPLPARSSRGPTAQKILPLVVNLADPSPSQGWKGLERKSLPERGKPELTLCLALIHHIVISANIPMARLRRLARRASARRSSSSSSAATTRWFRRFCANKDDQYGDYTQENFEALLAARFDIRDSRPLKGGKRVIYFAIGRG